VRLRLLILDLVVETVIIAAKLAPALAGRAQPFPTLPFSLRFGQSARGLVHSMTLRAFRKSLCNAPVSWTAVALHHFHSATPLRIAESRSVVAQIGNLPFRRLATCTLPRQPTPADCQSATQQAASLRYLSRFPRVLRK